MPLGVLALFSFFFQGKDDTALPFFFFTLIYDACAKRKVALESMFSPQVGKDRGQDGGKTELLY